MTLSFIIESFIGLSLTFRIKNLSINLSVLYVLGEIEEIYCFWFCEI